MARIRTVKPEFFTSEDIVALDAFSRLLYIALWCEADKEGRLLWRPKTFKMRYFPADNLDIEAMCKQLTDAGLVVTYGDGQFAHIPQFAKHQHINPRETASTLPDPDASSTRAARVRHASVTKETRDSDAQGGREGKGREGDTPLPPKGGERFEDFWLAWPKNDRKQDKGKCLELWKAKGLDAVADGILADVKAKRGTAKWRDGFIEAPAVYLRNERWKDGGLQGSTDGALPRWCTNAGFENVHEAHNAGCFEHTAEQFRDGQRIREAA